MRAGNNADIILSEDGTFMGFDLSSDYCAEHEWGLKFLKSFGIPGDKEVGVKRRKITKLPDLPEESWLTPRQLCFFQKRGSKKQSYLIFDYPSNVEYIKENKGLSREFFLDKFNKTEVAGAWDSESFGVATSKYHSEILELYEAFQKFDIVIGTFGGGVFQNAGLKILIASRIPKDIKNDWTHDDNDRNNLEKASEKTGIHKKLEKAGKKYYALSPSWHEGNDMSTKSPVVYWLNPCDQDINNSCWCTVEDLELWIQGKGKIVKGASI